jgi:GT2 family glycosyltransferase
MKVSIIIPNYNGAKILRRNLAKVVEIAGDAEIVVVDDASSDESLKELASFKEKIKIIKNEENLGFSSTINRGVEMARGEIVILLNSDVVPEKGFLAPLLSHFNDENVFAVGCMDKSIEGDKIILRGRGLGEWKRGFLVHSRGEINKTNTLWVTGGSGAFRKSIWKKLGGFCVLYSPFYWEDIDLSYRALKSGYKIIFDPKSIVIHEHEKGAIKNTYSDFKIKTIAYRNQIIFVWKNITDRSMIFNHLFWFPYDIISSLMRGDWAFIKGVLGAFILLPKIIKYSNMEKKNFVLRDDQVLMPFKSEK